MNSVESGLATVGRIESKIHLFVFGFFGLALIAFGIDSLAKEYRNKNLQQENKKTNYHPYVLMAVGLMFIFVAYGNYYLTSKSTTYAALEGAEDIARVL